MASTVVAFIRPARNPTVIQKSSQLQHL